MKSKVLDRPMFKKKGAPVPPEEADNVGIMQGFMDAINDMEEDDYEEEDDSDMAEMLDRRPDSPEILMNNLRGDMRSVDARVEELADLVGYRAAAETPTEVLALLQPVLAQQSQMAAPPPGGMMPAPPMPMPGAPMEAPAGGVADLAAMAQGPQTMPPPVTPSAPMPEGGIASLPAAAEQQAPIAMKEGGIVQHFQAGSGEEGVTPVDLSGQQAYYPPEIVAKAQEDVMNLMSAQPAQTPSIESAMAARLPTYERLLGVDKNTVQSQMLFDIAQGALNVAAGVDAEGRPIRGAVSPVGRIAAGMRNVPAMIGARAGELAKAQREIKALALQAGEKDVALIREYNFKLIDSQRKLSADIIKAAARGQGFGTGVKGAAWNFVTRFAPDFAAGKLTPENDRRFLSSYSIIAEPTYFTDPYTGTVQSRVPPIPDFVTNSIRARKDIPPPDTGAPEGTTGKKAPVSAPIASVRGEKTLWELTPVLTGPVPSVQSAISSVPGFGNVGKEVTQARSRYMGEFRELIKSLQTNPQYAVREMEAIQKELDVEPRFFDDPAKLRNKLIGIETFLTGRLATAILTSTNDEVPMEVRKEYGKVAETLKAFIPKLGIPEKIYTEKARQNFIKNKPPGTPYLWNGTTVQYTEPVALTTREEVERFSKSSPPNTPFMYNGTLYFTKGASK